MPYIPVSSQEKSMTNYEKSESASTARRKGIWLETAERRIRTAPPDKRTRGRNYSSISTVPKKRKLLTIVKVRTKDNLPQGGKPTQL